MTVPPEIIAPESEIIDVFQAAGLEAADINILSQVFH